MIGHRKLSVAVAVIVLLTSVAVPVWAERGDRDRDKDSDRGRVTTDRGDRSDRGGQRSDRDRSPNQRPQPQVQVRPRGYVLDQSHRHNRYYPPRGYRTPGLSPAHRIVPYRGRRYYYDRGVWYRHSGTSFIVILPPIGVMIPILPPFYTTIWVGSIPYYYANGVYYVWQPEQRVYVVTNPPPESAITEEPATPEKLFIYPKLGQSEEQQAADRYQCHGWAMKETGFDPTRADGNVDESQYFDKRSDYQRAMKACLEARGYSVK